MHVTHNTWFNRNSKVIVSSRRVYSKHGHLLLVRQSPARMLNKGIPASPALGAR